MTPEQAKKLRDDSQKESGLTGRDWYGKIYLKSEHWLRLRVKRLVFARRKCERCSCDKLLEVHHVNYKNIYDVELIDLLVLCKTCHKKEHGIVRKNKPIKKLVKDIDKSDNNLEQKESFVINMKSIMHGVNCLLKYYPNGKFDARKDQCVEFIYKILIDNNKITQKFLQQMITAVRSKRLRTIFKNHLRTIIKK